MGGEVGVVQIASFGIKHLKALRRPRSPRRHLAILLTVALVLSGCSEADAHNRTQYRAMDACKDEVDRLSTVARKRPQVIMIGFHDEDTVDNGNTRAAALGCLLYEFDAPDDLYQQIAQTNSAQGNRVAEWGRHRLVWTITRRDGLQAVFGRRGIPSGVTVHHRYP